MNNFEFGDIFLELMFDDNDDLKRVKIHMISSLDNRKKNLNHFDFFSDFLCFRRFQFFIGEGGTSDT